MEDDGKELKIYTSLGYAWIYNPKDIASIIIITGGFTKCQNTLIHTTK